MGGGRGEVVSKYGASSWYNGSVMMPWFHRPQTHPFIRSVGIAGRALSYLEINLIGRRFERRMVYL